MKQNKILGMLVGICILLIIVATPILAIEIITGNSNMPINKITYSVNTSNTGLQEYYAQTIYNLSESSNQSNNSTYNDTTVISIITESLTHNINYGCTLQVNNQTYTHNGTTTAVDETIIINQPLLANITNTTLLHLYCLYNISAIQNITNTTINSANNSTIEDSNVTYTNISSSEYSNKTIIIDYEKPIISIIHPGIINTTENDVSVTFELYIMDENPTSCIFNINNQSIPINSTSNLTTTLSPRNYSYDLTCNDIVNNTAVMNGSINIIKIIIIEEPFFNIIMSKSSFNLAELGQYMINANNGSNVSITICPIAQGWVQCYMTPDFIEDIYPKTQVMPYTNKTGTYLIEGVMKWNNYTIKTNVTFNIINTVTADITLSDKSSPVNKIITYNATATGGIAPYTYKWTMYDGQVFTGQGAYKTYTIPGKYYVNLTVNDSQGNSYSTTESVKIKSYYDIKAITTDKNTNTRLSGVLIEVNNNDDHNVTTNNNGEATLRLVEGKYDLYASKENYGVVIQDIDLDENLTVYINMSYEDFDAPIITLLTDDASSFAKSSVKLKFKADDETRIYCELYIAEKNDSWFALKDYGDNLLTNTEYTFELTDLDIGAYEWKISCRDKQSNIAISSIKSFIVSDGSIAQAINNAENTNNNINTALDKIYSLSGSEAEIADILGVKESLKTILDKSSSLDRDIYNLAYRRDLDEKGKEDAQKQLIQNIEYIKANTPINIEVTDVKNFVKYIKEEDLKQLLETYKSIKNLNINSKLFLESIKRTQSKAVISTKAMNAKLYYTDGLAREITIVIKDINIGNSDDAALLNSHGVTFVERVPKEVAQTAKLLNMINKDYTIIRDDPLIEFPSSTKRIIYYINDTIDLAKIQNIDTVIIDKNIDISQSVTGFSILGMGSVNDMSIDGKGVLIIIIIALILIYLIINLEIIDKIKSLFSGVKKKVSYITLLLNDADDHLNIADYDKAALIYHEIKLTYEASNESVQKQIYDVCYAFCNKLDIFYFNELSAEAEDMIRNNQAAIEIYDKMVMTYNKIDDKYKKDIEQKLIMIKRKVLH